VALVVLCLLQVAFGLQPSSVALAARERRFASSFSVRGGAAGASDDPDPGDDDDDDDDDDEYDDDDNDDDDDEDEDDDDDVGDDEEKAVAEDDDEPELIFGMEKPVLIRLAMMSALTLTLNLLLPKPSAVAERQFQEAKRQRELAENATKAEVLEETTTTEEAQDDDDLEIYEEDDLDQQKQQGLLA